MRDNGLKTSVSKTIEKFVFGFSRKFQEQFSNEFLKDQARFCGFQKRQRKVTPLAFINSLVYHCFTNAEISLNDHVIDLERKENIVITKQSLNQRFTGTSVDFVKSLAEKQFREQIIDEGLKEGVLKHWDNVYLHDSTQFALSGQMAKYFKGYGGAIKSESIIKIQHGYELKTGKLQVHQIGDAHSQDVTSGKQTLDCYKEGDLLLRDLGYFDLQSFGLLSQDNGAEYISRLKPKTTIFELNGERLDLKKLAGEMKKGNTSFIDKRVVIGAKEKVEVRIIISLASHEVVKERLRKTNKHNKSKGCQTSEEYKQYAALNIYITNVGQEKLTTQQVLELYRLRWQVELLFKTWKSYYKIHRIKDCNCFRTLCYLYATLLIIQVNWEISSFAHALANRHLEQPLSILKLMKACLQYKSDQREWPRQPLDQVASQLWEMFLNLLRNTVREKRKKRHNYQDILGSIC